ncbi:TIGR03618 family F420-dependent PPOX class oxidoreductase [Saccharothrix luteola]|uniref:TIGR03618 family F420-dependent PPOX class oxidoreductase n=1 Tax=Saccharothrix luteola TaxID=2893018 RepID=UPI001E3E5556|nr:TIGR03618 family F420-dependent PPOX class oxidoreductase [Saccharothrix luteola]MCC8249961.1 TIGR03618 family F420-dependent PPOX class oxidoreductase [Saccharothrix luteola]
MEGIVQIPESHRDLLDVQTAALSTIGSDGRPQVTATWFIYDENEGTVKMWLLDHRQKVKNMRANPRVTLFILDPRNQFRALEIRADAELAADPEMVLERQVSPKYYYPDFRRYEPNGETRSAVTLHIVKVNALDEPPPDWEDVTPR